MPSSGADGLAAGASASWSPVQPDSSNSDTSFGASDVLARDNSLCLKREANMLTKLRPLNLNFRFRPPADAILRPDPTNGNHRRNHAPNHLSLPSFSPHPHAISETQPSRKIQDPRPQILRPHNQCLLS